MKKRIGFGSTAVVALALAVLGPAVAQSQVWLCFVYFKSHPDTGNNVCHGAGSGCMECLPFEFSRVDDGAPIDSLRQGATVASYAPRFDQAQEPDQPVSLALDTGLLRARLERPTCEEPSLYDRVRRASLARIPRVVRGRSPGRLEQAPAP